MDELCMGCMQNKGNVVICPQCGWVEGTQPEAPVHLPPRTILARRYLLGRVLGQGGFGITYLGWDLVLKTRVAIKEYMPQLIATRATGDIDIIAYESRGGPESYQYGLRKFLEEARTVAQMDDNPGIVAVRDFFEANSTAYLVMPYLDGMTLKEYLGSKGGKIPFGEAMRIMEQVLETLCYVHEKGLLHRDISPDNIFITRSQQIKILDFGAARYAVGDQSRSLSVILKPGYAPEEQYRSKGLQGPWTDEYSAAATFYRAITGQVPPEALERLHVDELAPPSRLGAAIPPPAEAALLKALSVQEKQRFRNVKDFLHALHSGVQATAPPALVRPPMLDKTAAYSPNMQSANPPVSNIQPQAPGGPAAGVFPAGVNMGPPAAGAVSPAANPPLPAGSRAPGPVAQPMYPPGSYPPPGFADPRIGRQAPPAYAAPYQAAGRKTGKKKGGKGKLALVFFMLVIAGFGALLVATGIVKINLDKPVARLDYPDGTAYRGEYDSELSYEGDYVNGLFEGRGTYTWHKTKDITVQYVGNFKQGKLEGSGTYTGLRGESYTGSFSEGMFNGSGRLDEDDGYIYKGFFTDGMPDGDGEATFSDGTVYQGSFVNGVMEGEGILTWPDDSSYEGEFADDLPNGMGYLYDENGYLIFQGYFEDGEPVTQ